MKTLPLLLFVILASGACGKSETEPLRAEKSAPPPLPQAAGSLKPSTELLAFEGEVGVVVRSRDQTRETTPILMQIKGDKFRFDLPEDAMGKSPISKNAHVIVRPVQKQLSMVLPDRKQVVNIDLEKLGDELKKFSNAAANEPPNEQPTKTQVTKTGALSEVGGRRCEEWEFVDEKGKKARLCIASESTAWFRLPTIGLPTEHAWARELFDGHHLPLRVVSFDASGAEEGRIEVTKLEKKTIADAAFEVPANYEAVDLAALLGGMMAGAFPPGVKVPAQLVGADGKMPPHVQEMMRKMAERAKATKAKAAKAKGQKTP